MEICKVVLSFLYVIIPFCTLILTGFLMKVTCNMRNITHKQMETTRDQFEKNKKYFNFNLITVTLNAFSTNKNLQDTYYNYFEYNIKKFVSGKGKTLDSEEKRQEEREVDALLRVFATPAIAWRYKLIDIEDLFPLEYYICRTVENTGIKDYLKWFVEEWLKQEGIEEHPFKSLRLLSEELIKHNPKLLNRTI